MSLTVSAGYDGVPPSSSSLKQRRSSSSASQQTRVRLNVETIRLHLSTWVVRLNSRVSMETLRPLPLFLGISGKKNAVVVCVCDAGAFTAPVRKLDKSCIEKINSRFALNAAFFLTNYVLVTCMVGLIVALLHPGMLFFVGLCYGLWTFHAFLIRHEFELFGIPLHSIISIQKRFYLLFIFTSVVVVWKCLVPALLFVILSSLLVTVHALLRDPKHIESMDAASTAADASADASNEVHSGRSRHRYGISSDRGTGGYNDGGDDDDSDDYNQDDEEANMASSSSSGSEKGVVLVQRPISTTTMTKRRGDVI